MYWLWALAFMLKVIGATMDVSWHFMHLRETLGIPHIVNTVGFMLAIGLMLYQTRKGAFQSPWAGGLVWTGLAVFLLAIPADEYYHQLYGLDLTAWSPTHSLLYLGTFFMICGAFVDYLRSSEPKQSGTGLLLSLLFCFFLMDDVLFPLGQQENGATSLFALAQGRPWADPELLAFVSDPFKQAYGSFPLWLYPVYLVGGAMFVLGITRHSVAHRWSATMVTAIYLTYRALAWTVLSAVDWPAPFVPYFLIAMALAVDLSARWLPQGVRWVVGGSAAALIAYGAASFWPNLAIMPIWPQESWWLAVIGGVAGLGAGHLLAAHWPTAIRGVWNLVRPRAA